MGSTICVMGRLVAALLLAAVCVAGNAEGVNLPEAANGLIAKGDAQWSAGNAEQAQKMFEQAVKLDSRSERARMKLAGCELARNDFKGSIEAYHQAIGLDAKNALAWIGLGISYMHAGSNDLSLAAFGEAVRIDPGRKEQLAVVMAKLAVSE